MSELEALAAECDKAADTDEYAFEGALAPVLRRAAAALREPRFSPEEREALEWMAQHMTRRQIGQSEGRWRLLLAMLSDSAPSEGTKT